MDVNKFLDAAGAARKAAIEVARRLQWDASGTCNFDACAVHSQGHGRSVVAFLHEVGLRGYERQGGMWDGYVLVEPPVGGQGTIRTLQAEAMADAFEAAGFKACVFYQMD